MGGACAAPKEEKAQESWPPRGDFKLQPEQPTEPIEEGGVDDDSFAKAGAKVDIQAKIQEGADGLLRAASQDREEASKLLEQVEQSRGDAVRKHTDHQAQSAGFHKLRSTAAEQLRVAARLDESSRRLLQQSEGLLTASHQAAMVSHEFLDQARAAHSLAGSAEELAAAVQRGHGSVVDIWDQLGVKGKDLLRVATEGEAAAASASKLSEALHSDAGPPQSGKDVDVAEAAALEASEALQKQQFQGQDTGDVVSQAATKAEASAKHAEEEARRAKMWQETVSNFQRLHNANRSAGAVKQEVRKLLERTRATDERLGNDMTKHTYQLIQLRELMAKMGSCRQGAERAEAEVARKAQDIAREQVGTSVARTQGRLAGSGAEPHEGPDPGGTRDVAVWLAGLRGVPQEVAACSLCRCFSSARPSHALFESGLADDSRPAGPVAALPLADFHPADVLLFSVWARIDEGGSGGGVGPAPERFVGAAALHGGSLPACGTYTANLPVCGGEHAEAFLSLRLEVRPCSPQPLRPEPSAPEPATPAGSWLGSG